MTKKKGKSKKHEDAWWRKYTRDFVEEPRIDKPRKTIERIPEERYFDPFARFESIQKQMDRMFKNIFSRDFFRFTETPHLLRMKEGTFRQPYVHIKETDKHVFVRAELPGIRKEDIRIKVEGQSLIIDAQTQRRSEKKEEGFVGISSSYNGFRHVVRLPAEVEEKQSKAKYEQGVLKIILPKKYPRKGPSDIPIE